MHSLPMAESDCQASSFTVTPGKGSGVFELSQ